jgi:hypothetical protein
MAVFIFLDLFSFLFTFVHSSVPAHVEADKKVYLFCHGSPVVIILNVDRRLLKDKISKT